MSKQPTGPQPLHQQPIQQPLQLIQQEHRIAQPLPSVPTPPNLTPDLERGLESPSEQQASAPLPRQPSPPRAKSMFDFTSPFDVLASTTSPSGPQPSSGSMRKKPVPAMNNDPNLGTNSDEPSSPNLGSLQDPRRRSVENLLEGLGMVPAPVPDVKPKQIQQQPQSKASPRAPTPRELTRALSVTCRSHFDSSGPCQQGATGTVTCRSWSAACESVAADPTATASTRQRPQEAAATATTAATAAATAADTGYCWVRELSADFIIMFI